MNCLQFRRAYCADPYHVARTLRAHRAHCAACDSYASAQDRFDNNIAGALRIGIPAGLEARILQRRAHAECRAASRGAHRRLAVAALLLLALSLGVLIDPGQRQEALGEAVVDFVHNQTTAGMAAVEISASDLDAMFRSVGMSFETGIVRVRHAQPCRIRGTNALFLVVLSPSGPLSVLVMPEQNIPRRMPINDAGLQGAIVRCPKGSMAIVGQPGQPIDHTEALMRAATAVL
jgi:hypothetical protein